MIRLSREIRFALVPPNQVPAGDPGNSWAGWPSSNLIIPHLVLRCVIEGTVDPETGYLCNIKIIDRLLREVVNLRLVPWYNGRQTAEELIQMIHRETMAGWQHPAKIVSMSL